MEYDEALDNLKSIKSTEKSLDDSVNEATTRFKLIDRLLSECFGWESSDMRLEEAQGQEYSDYEFLNPVKMIWEAKKVGVSFRIPVSSKKSISKSIRGIKLASVQAEKAINQVNNYCLNRGAEIAVITNGHQIIAFRASRSAQVGPKDMAIVFESLDHLEDNFVDAWDFFSRTGIEGDVLLNKLESYAVATPPQKLSREIPQYPQVRNPSDMHRSMADISELLLLNIDENEDVERRFFEECYCESGALNQHSLISKKMLSARYESLFSDAEDAPETSPVVGKGREPKLTPEVLVGSISARPIALLGDVGVGKTSFLKHLMYVSAFSEFQRAIYVYINMGRKGVLDSDPREVVLNSIETALLNGYGIDITEKSFVFAVYKKEIERFDKTIWGSKKESNYEKYEEKLFEEIEKHQNNRSEHIRKSVEYLARRRKKQIIIAIDNADQRKKEVQQEAFLIAQNLAAEWRATVFISVRPKTFFYSKRSGGAMSAYPHRIFTISPPRIDEVIAKRLSFAKRIADGEISIEKLKYTSFQLGGVSALFKVFMDSIDRSDEVKVFLENITAGNIRELMQFISGYFGNPNIDLRQIVDSLEQGEDYLIPAHELWKVAIKGDGIYFDSERAIAMNIYDVSTDDPREHFLCPIILGMLFEDHPRRNGEGFMDHHDIVEGCQDKGFSKRAIEAAIRRMNNKNLIEAPERVKFEEDTEGIILEGKMAFRITSLGAYHLNVWSASFPYLDAMAVDTPIFDEEVVEEIKPKIRSLLLEDRLERAQKVRDYLTSIWESNDLENEFFKWEACRVKGEFTFERVKRALSRRGAR